MSGTILRNTFKVGGTFSRPEDVGSVFNRTSVMDSVDNRIYVVITNRFRFAL